MFLTVKEAIKVSGKSQTTIHRLCQKFDKTKHIKKENNKYLIEKDFLMGKFPNKGFNIDPTELINPSTGENLLKSLTEKNVHITDLTVGNKSLTEDIEKKNSEIEKLKEDLLDSHHELAEINEVNMNLEKELSASNITQLELSEGDSDIEGEKKLVRYQIIGITISVMVLIAFIFTMYYLTK